MAQGWGFPCHTVIIQNFTGVTVSFLKAGYKEGNPKAGTELDPKQTGTPKGFQSLLSLTRESGNLSIFN